MPVATARKGTRVVSLLIIVGCSKTVEETNGVLWSEEAKKTYHLKYFLGLSVLSVGDGGA